MPGFQRFRKGPPSVQSISKTSLAIFAGEILVSWESQDRHSPKVRLKIGPLHDGLSDFIQPCRTIH